MAPCRGAVALVFPALLGVDAVLVAPAYTYSGVGGSNSLEDLASLERFQPDNVEMDPASLNSLNDLDTKHLVIPGAAYSSPNALDQPQPYFRESVAHSHGSINSIEQSGRSPKNGPGYAGLLLPGAAEAGSPSGDVVLRRSARGSAGSRLSTGSPPSRSSASEVGSHHTVFEVPTSRAPVDAATATVHVSPNGDTAQLTLVGADGNVENVEELPPQAASVNMQLRDILVQITNNINNGVQITNNGVQIQNNNLHFHIHLPSTQAAASSQPPPPSTQPPPAQPPRTQPAPQLALASPVVGPGEGTEEPLLAIEDIDRSGESVEDVELLPAEHDFAESPLPDDEDVCMADPDDFDGGDPPAPPAPDVLSPVGSPDMTLALVPQTTLPSQCLFPFSLSPYSAARERCARWFAKPLRCLKSRLPQILKRALRGAQLVGSALTYGGRAVVSFYSVMSYLMGLLWPHLPSAKAVVRGLRGVGMGISYAWSGIKFVAWLSGNVLNVAVMFSDAGRRWVYVNLLRQKVVKGHTFFSVPAPSRSSRSSWTSSLWEPEAEP